MGVSMSQANGHDADVNTGSAETSKATSIFDDLDALRVDNIGSLTGTIEVLSHVPVRKPTRTEFIRVHPDPKMSLEASIYEDKEERDTYFVPPPSRHLLVGYLTPVLISVAINRQGTLFLWPIKLNVDEGTKRGGGRAWNETAMAGAEIGRTTWVQLRSDMSLGAYRIRHAGGELPDPVWPSYSLNELLKLGFKDRIIDRAEHPVVRGLRGLI
jgi:hypothetical protein